MRVRGTLRDSVAMGKREAPLALTPTRLHSVPEFETMRREEKIKNQSYSLYYQSKEAARCLLHGTINATRSALSSKFPLPTSKSVF